MPKRSEEPSRNGQAQRSTPENKPVQVDPLMTCIESTYFLGGLFTEFQNQVNRYQAMTAQLASLMAQIEIAEKTLCVVRDHLADATKEVDSAQPRDWSKVLNQVRFVGRRLADACVMLLKEHTRMTPQEILRGLNSGMFRFRTNSPLREIHAALLRHPMVSREGDSWVWTAADKDSEESPVEIASAEETE